MTLAFDLLTLKVVSESRVTWATSVPILVFLGLSVLDLGPMYATDVRHVRCQTKASLNPPPLRGGGIIIGLAVLCFYSKTVFDPRTAKSQPFWIKFCTHILLYGIHFWADLDRDRRMGGSRPNQNDCF